MRAFLIFVLLYVLLAFIVSAVNFIKNSKIIGNTFFDLIENQNRGAVSSLRFGLKNTGYNGCGWIACHNVMTLLGKKTLPHITVLSLEMLLSPLCLGFFGANPLSLVIYLRLCGFKVKLRFNRQNIDACLADCGIVLYMTRRHSAHYVAYKKLDGAYLLHNPCVKCNSLTEYFDRIFAKFIMAIEISPKGHN